MSQLERLSSASLKRRNISIPLFSQFDDSTSPDKAKFQEQLLDRLKVSDNVYKRTYKNRFESFDKQVAASLKEIFCDRAPSIHDMAVSDGRTSVAFYETVCRTLPQAPKKYLASDKFQTFKLVSIPGKKYQLVFDANGQPCQFIAPPFVFNLFRKERFLYYPINRMALAYYRDTISTLKRRYLAKDSELSVESFDIVCGEFLKLTINHANVEFRSFDFTKPQPEMFDVIRVMNALNGSYFSPDQLSQIIENIFAGLCEGGLFVVGSNEGPETEVQGAIYRKIGPTLVPLAKSGEGFPFDDLVRQIGISQ